MYTAFPNNITIPLLTRHIPRILQVSGFTAYSTISTMHSCYIAGCRLPVQCDTSVMSTTCIGGCRSTNSFTICINHFQSLNLGMLGLSSAYVWLACAVLGCSVTSNGKDPNSTPCNGIVHKPEKETSIPGRNQARIENSIELYIK